jgi:hypothetical protein
VFDSAALLGIKLIEIYRGFKHESSLDMRIRDTEERRNA